MWLDHLTLTLSLHPRFFVVPYCSEMLNLLCLLVLLCLLQGVTATPTLPSVITEQITKTVPDSFLQTLGNPSTGIFSYLARNYGSLEISDPGFVFAASVTDQGVLDNLFVGDATNMPTTVQWAVGTQRSFVVHFLRRVIWATRALEATRDQLTAAANTIAETQVITEKITNAFTASSLPLAWAAIKVQIVWLKNLQNASGNDKASLRDLTKWSTIASGFRTALSEIMFPGQ